MDRRAFAPNTPQDDSPIDTQSSAKYIQGSISMLRSKKLIIPSLRNGVMVINIEDGGSLSFYKVFRATSSCNRDGKSGSTGGMRRSSSTNSLLDCDTHSMVSASMMEASSMPLNGGEKESIFLRKSQSRRRVMDVDEETKAKIDKVSIYVSSSPFVEPMEMPYLCIPSSVPWVFKSLNKFKNEYFKITVPPLPNGELDTRVKLMSFAEKVKKFMHVTALVDGKLLTFGTVIDNSARDSSFREGDDKPNNTDTDEFDDDNMNESLAESTLTIKRTNKNSQIFIFRCPNARDLAIYAKTALRLNRMHTENRIKRSTTLFATTTKRVRTAEGLEIALQTEILDRNMNKKEMASKKNTLGAKEYRCLPLYAYPYSWLTDRELLDETVRESRVWCDLRENTVNEMGWLRMEILQCTGIPKMDYHSLSDPFVYVVCGSAAFVTDVIQDKLDAYWLPLSRRACILPIMNAYSQVYLGCFDYDGEKEMDDFIGRVVLDIPQIQAEYTYDVKLPLRDSSRVYNRSQLGFIRIRFRLEWNEGGERAALLSYLPKPDDLKKRMKNELDAVTVKCPDSKSFYNIAHTVYGRDIPGKFSPSINTATTKELSMIITMMIFSIMRTTKDISTWKHPLLSGYIFFWWMHFVIANSIALVPAFLMSLVVVLLLRNYVKYYVKSSNALLYGYKTMGDMIRMLLFKKYIPQPRHRGSGEWRHEDRPYLELLLLQIFGMSTKTIDPQYKWRYENHAEFPFSVGTSYPKITHLDANEDVPWNDDDEDTDDEFAIDYQPEEASKMKEKMINMSAANKLLSTGKHVEDTTSQEKNSNRAARRTVFSADMLKKNVTSSTPDISTVGVTGLSSSIFRQRKSATGADADSSFEPPASLTQTESSATESPESGERAGKNPSSTESILASPPRRAPAARRPSSSLKSSLRSSAKKIILTQKIKESKVSFGDDDLRQNSSRSSLLATDQFPDNLPEQNIKAKKGGAKKSKPIQDQINELHETTQKATLHLFDDRVFLVEGDRQDGDKVLMLHHSLNPALRVINPLLGSVFKIVDTNLNAFRAVFNIFMWKDPALSFWATILAICVMYVLFLFPWRWFFCIVGLFAVGPQNYFLADWYEERQSTKKKRKSEQAANTSSFRRTKPVDLSSSPLLMRNNVQQKPDGKSREIIIPSVPLRYNRFYDWPPDPSTTIIKK